MTNRYEHFRQIAINSIDEALQKHEMKDYLSIAENIDNFEALVDEKEIKHDSSLHIALEFLSGWSDSAAHSWCHYEPLKKEDWPRMAQIILNDLRANKEISDSEILSEFRYNPESKISIISKIKTLFKLNKT